jgi:hypothetical protein
MRDEIEHQQASEYQRSQDDVKEGPCAHDEE